MALDINKKYKDTVKKDLSVEQLLSETIEPSDEVPDYEEPKDPPKVVLNKTEPAPVVTPVEVKPVKVEKNDVQVKSTSKEKNKPSNKPQIVKEAKDVQLKGKKANKETVDKIKKIPEAFIIIHEKESAPQEKESLSERAQKSRTASAGTQLLNEQTCGQLKREDNGDIVVINKPVFKIGKSAKFADYVVQGNTAISRKHVEIITRNGRCYVRDKNSTNGTFVDGTQLPPETEMQIKAGQTLTIANVNFIFEIR